MSPFINAGLEKQESPPLKLVPSDADMAMPTSRGCIEERHEQWVHEHFGSGEDRTPVFVPTPKVPSCDFAKPSGPPKKGVAKELTFADLPAKTPKRGFLERLKISTNLRGTHSPSTSTLSSMQDFEVQENMPAKAQAVLGASPPKGRNSLGSSTSRISMPRSPSKRKGLFSRKNVGVPDINASKASFATSAESDHPPPTASTVTKTPQTAISDPTHYSFQSKHTRTPQTAISDSNHYSFQSMRTVSQTLSDKGTTQPHEAKKCAVVRSQSLKYFDHGAPPTPPAKNTPPSEKAKREAACTAKSSRLPFHEGNVTSPKVPDGIVSTSGRLSPTRFGSYGHRETATLVTRPSVYSLHASVVPDMMEATTFEEMKARFDGLALEGFSTPEENMRSPIASVKYTPSIYSTDWAARPSSAFAAVSPQVQREPRESQTPSSHTKGSSSNGEIPVFYPDLARDLSMNAITPVSRTNGLSGSERRPDREHLDPKLPWEGHTGSRGHSISPRQSVGSTIFTPHVDDDVKDTFYDSPTSFSHASATPSPLHTLPATVYKPPPRQSSKQDKYSGGFVIKRGAPGDNVLSSGLGIVQNASRSNSASPSRRNEIFENAPALRAHAGNAGYVHRSPSPQDQSTGVDFNDLVDVDPQKQSPAKSTPIDKLDRMIEMLNTLNARNSDIANIRDEMRSSNVRLGQRLAAIERSSPTPPPSYNHEDESAATNEMSGRGSAQSHRVPTQVAHEFYRSAEVTQDEEEEDPAAAELAESSTIAELKETNRRLLEMVGGFAEKIQALEKKVGGDH